MNLAEQKTKWLKKEACSNDASHSNDMLTYKTQSTKAQEIQEGVVNNSNVHVYYINMNNCNHVYINCFKSVCWTVLNYEWIHTEVGPEWQRCQEKIYIPAECQLSFKHRIRKITGVNDRVQMLLGHGLCNIFSDSFVKFNKLSVHKLDGLKLMDSVIILMSVFPRLISQ